jgi:heme iron utilization protein
VTSRPETLRPTDAEALRLAKTLLRTARSGALATLDPASGWPLATRVGVSTDIDGTPTILVSALAAHTPALRADPRCALLLGRPGKGDPLAHARMSLSCSAVEIVPGSDKHIRIAGRYLAHQEKAKLYADLPDFRYFQLVPSSVSLNAGFGKAYSPSVANLLVDSPANADLAAIEAEAMEHMNRDHPDAIALIVRHFAGGRAGSWKLVGIDAEGLDLTQGDDVRRVFFPQPLGAAGDLRAALTQMANTARAAFRD